MPSSPVNGGGSLPFFSDVDQLPLGTEPDPMPFEDDEDERDELAELANLDLLPDDDEDDDGEDLFGSDMAR